MNASVPIMPIVSLRSVLVTAWHDHVLHAILLVFLLLTLAWNFVTPIFETPDEPDHLQYILFVANQGRLPDLRTDVGQAGIESPQPPLYYLLLGYALRVYGRSIPFVHPTRNPSFSFNPTVGDPNYFVPSTDRFDYVHILRAISALFGLFTVVCSYVLASLLGARRALRIVVTLVTALLPQFTFISSAVSNDALTAALGSISMVWLIYALGRSPLRSWHWLVYGVCCGLTFLSKEHTIFLAPFGIFAVFVSGNQTYKKISAGAYNIIGFALIAGPYLLYNQLHYGDPTAVNMQMLIVPDLVTRRSILVVNDLMFESIVLPSLLFLSFLGVFGWMKLILPTVFYIFYGILWFGALVGIATGVLSKRWDAVRITLVAVPLAVFLVIVYVNLTFIAPQGRYFFPVLDVISFIFVLGLAELPIAWRRLSLVVAPLFLLGANIYSLWLVWHTFTR